MKRTKGQESAPFELMVAVVLMSFVLLVAYQAIEKVRVTTCQQDNEKSLENMQTALEFVAKNKGTTNVDFDIEACTSGDNPSVTLRTESQNYLCASYCGDARNICVLLQLHSKFKPVTKCIGVNYRTNFPTGEGGICAHRDGASLVNLYDEMGIPEGDYSFLNAQTISSDPVVCAYRLGKG
ncbi:MAG: hypothetical protein V1847_03195 [Candidatus Diapherotrites archaeon]